MKAEVVEVNPQNPDKKKLEKAAQITRKGGVVVFPTDTVYGLGASALDERAVREVFEIKGRAFDKPLIIFPPTAFYFQNLLKGLPAEAQKLARKLAAQFWPGPLTIIVPYPKNTVLHISRKKPATLGLRIPNNRVVLILLQLLNLPLATTSANLSGSPSPVSAKEALDELGDEVDLIIDAGLTEHKAVSTVLDLTAKPVAILRQGALSSLEVNSFMKQIS